MSMSKTAVTTLALVSLVCIAGCGPTENAEDAKGEANETPAVETAETAQVNDAVPPSGDFATETHRFEEVAPGVYFVRYTVPMFNSNSMVIVGEDDVIVVDSHITPATARELIASIRHITDLPVGVLINTHFHYDHAHGNQAFEGAEIIGHEFTRLKMAGTPLEEKTFTDYAGRVASGLEGLEAQLANIESDDEREGVETRLATLQAHQATLDEVAPVPPNITLNERITLYRGEREIQIVFCGRAHTGGDVVVYLPDERLVFTGDMMLGGPSWLGDGHVDEWPQTLENLKALDFDVILPGHGDKVTDRALIDHVQDFYRELWAQVATLRSEGKSAEEAATAVDLTAFRNRLPSVQRTGYDRQAVERIYQLLDERET